MFTGSNQMFCLVSVGNIAFNFLQDMEKLYTLAANTIPFLVCGVPGLISIQGSDLHQTVPAGKQVGVTKWRSRKNWVEQERPLIRAMKAIFPVLSTLSFKT